MYNKFVIKNHFMNYLLKSLSIALCLCCLSKVGYTQEISSQKVMPTEDLPKYLKQEVLNTFSQKERISTSELASHFRQTFSNRFFYDWETSEDRFMTYNVLYSNEQLHRERGNDHLSKYAGSTYWKLPFNYQNGEPVNAYALRHLARQHKMVDIAYLYFYEDKNPEYIRYFCKQMHSLNEALVNKKYELIEDGNGVYEVFRSGYRILNWLSIHNLFLAQEAYSDEDQLYTIATLLQHGAHLYERNKKFRYGNHQTRGMSALAMLAILFQDFKDSDAWYQLAMTRLGEHLNKEINADGFQFERSVHYHLSDIGNYFYVYRLAQISGMEVDKLWEERLFALFETLVKVAYPDKTAPVLQDDTDNPWAERNQISRTLTLGYLLFGKPEFGYFAENKVEDKIYWFLNKKQLAELETIKRKKPKYGSLHFPQTGYYITREGWSEKDNMMIISAGLDKDKPDHQHGDMLGIQAIANGHNILPNYQVRYSLPDYDWFKNSMVKNVALVDDELQGKEWTGNKGNSGFGKFRVLPQPRVIAWEITPHFDFFAGSHDGFSNKNIQYSRQVIYVKDDFWIVKDNFDADTPHTYKQVWQGHYTDENGPYLLRSSFSDGSGCEIYQLNAPDQVIQSGKRGKRWSVLEKNNQTDFSFISIIYPFKKYDDCIDEAQKSPAIGNWKTDNLPIDSDGTHSIFQNQEAFLFGVTKIKLEKIYIEFSENADLFISWKKGEGKIVSLTEKDIQVSISGENTKVLNKTLQPGQELGF